MYQPLPTIMKESEYIKGYFEVDTGLTLLFNQIYGYPELSNFNENATLDDYKNQFCKLIQTIKKSFNETCIKTDNYHKFEINNLIKDQITSLKKKKSIEEIFTSLIIFFPKLCFIIIGQLPQNGSINLHKDNRHSWKLDDYRQLEYRQNKIQKVKLLYELLKNDKIEGLNSYKEELEKFETTRQKDDCFLKWFCRNYPDKYFDLFENNKK